MPLNEWPRVLRISGEAQSGKTRALIAIANAALADGPVMYLSGFAHRMGRGVLLRAAGLGQDVKVVAALGDGHRPRTVVADEAELLGPAGVDRLVERCRVLGVLFLVIAETKA